MKINKNTSTNALPDADKQATNPTTKPDETNTHAANTQNNSTDPPVPPPISLAQYAATRSIHPLKDTMLAVAQNILRSKAPNPAATARDQVIELVLNETFRTVLTSKEQHEIADVLRVVLTDDPVFCTEIDEMLRLAEHKLKTDN